MAKNMTGTSKAIRLIECAHCGERVGAYYATCPYCGYRLVTASDGFWKRLMG